MPTPEALDALEPGVVVYVDMLWDLADDEVHPLCDADPIPTGGERHLGPHPQHRHVVVDVLPGPADRFPFNDVSCEYVPATMVLRVRGFYTPLWSSIPTARHLRLRPVAVPLQRARRAVRRATRQT